jgi:hypothetical protein
LAKRYTALPHGCVPSPTMSIFTAICKFAANDLIKLFYFTAPKLDCSPHRPPLAHFCLQPTSPPLSRLSFSPLTPNEALYRKTCFTVHPSHVRQLRVLPASWTPLIPIPNFSYPIPLLALDPSSESLGRSVMVPSCVLPSKEYIFPFTPLYLSQIWNIWPAVLLNIVFAAGTSF